MKAYIVYTSRTPGWMPCSLVTEEGDLLADHLCSDERFMLWDLWNRRKELKDKHDNLQVEETPIWIEDFERDYPHIFGKVWTRVEPIETGEE